MNVWYIDLRYDSSPAIILTADPGEEQGDKLYGTINDGTISTVAGVPQIHFHCEAGSLKEAIRSAIGDVQAVGIAVARVEMESAAVLQASGVSLTHDAPGRMTKLTCRGRLGER